MANEIYTVGEGQDYANIQDAIDAIPGDLAGAGHQQVIVNYFDADDHSIGYPETIDAYTGFSNASATNYIEILPAVAHNGVKGSGIKITLPDPTTPNIGIQIGAFCKFHGFEITGEATPTGAYIVLTALGASARMYDNIIDDILVNGSDPVTVINLSTLASWAYNNQIFNITAAGTKQGIGVSGNGNVSNQIRIMCNSVPDESIDIGSHTYIHCVLNYAKTFLNKVGAGNNVRMNVSSDATGNVIDRAAADQFTNLTAHAEDLRLLRTGACNKPYGDYLVSYFTTDCVETTRVKWCAGAIEYANTDMFLRGGADILSLNEAVQLPHFALSLVKTHNTEMLDTLLQVFHDKTIIAAFLTALGTQLQALEDAYWTILLRLYLDVAAGENLNVLGRIVGETRMGRTDDHYRIAIRARIKMNQCSGTVEQLLEIMNILYPRGVFIFEERPPASFRIFLNGRNPIYPTVEYFDKIIHECKTGGVGCSWHHSDNSEGHLFRFSINDSREESNTEGFADEYGHNGGHWTDMYTEE